MSQQRASTVEITVVVVDEHGREGIVVARRPRPSPLWFASQGDTTLEELPRDTPWFGVMLLGGGYAVMPQPRLRGLRVAEFADVWIAAENANLPGLRLLTDLFGEHMTKLMRHAELKVHYDPAQNHPQPATTCGPQQRGVWRSLGDIWIPPSRAV